MSRGALDSSYGKDSGRHLVAELEPGDLLTLRPYATRHAETVSLFDVYAWAIRCRVARAKSEQAHENKGRRVVQ
jgi:hypothetical protein